MEITDTTFKLAEEVIESILHFKREGKEVTLGLLIESIGKTRPYLMKAISFLKQINIIECSEDRIEFNNTIAKRLSVENLHPVSIIKKALTEFTPFSDYCRFVQNGKSEKSVLKIIKATYTITLDDSKLKNTFHKWLKYLEDDIKIAPIEINKVTRIPNKNSFFWIDENGQLIYDEEAHTKKIIQELESKRFKNPLFIDQNRIVDLRNISNQNFDLSKLIRLCEELNDAFQLGNYYTVGILTRAIIDHVPPIFGKKNFAEVINNYGSKSFKDAVQNLDAFSRKISDSMLHGHIKNKENLPNATTIDCKTAVDFLLGEIVNILK